MENENRVWEILDTLRNYSRADDSFELVYILLSYKVLVDFKHEKEYLRTPHILENYVETIDFEKIQKSNNLNELLNQMNFLNISVSMSFLNFNALIKLLYASLKFNVFISSRILL